MNPRIGGIWNRWCKRGLLYHNIVETGRESRVIGENVPDDHQILDSSSYSVFEEQNMSKNETAPALVFEGNGCCSRETILSAVRMGKTTHVGGPFHVAVKRSWPVRSAEDLC